VLLLQYGAASSPTLEERYYASLALVFVFRPQRTAPRPNN
jgi:hypothetical protein